MSVMSVMSVMTIWRHCDGESTKLDGKKGPVSGRAKGKCLRTRLVDVEVEDRQMKVRQYQRKASEKDSERTE